MNSSFTLFKRIFRNEYFWLSIIVFLAFIVRLYKIDNPIADWHSWRQADTSAVSRNFIKFGFDVLHPRFDDLSNIASGKDNPAGFRFVEFPIYNLATASLFKFLDKFTIEIWGRLVSIFASLGSLLFLYLITKKYLGVRVGFLAAFFFASLPFNIYFSRTILPEPTLVFVSLGMIYFFSRWLDSLSITFYLLSIIFGATSLLVKPFAAFLFLPLIYLSWRRWGAKFIFQPTLYLWLIISITPFVWWRWWMGHFPQGIPASDWLFNEGNIRFKGAFFWWIFEERVGRLILGVWGVALLGLGIVKKRQEREGLFFDFWFLGILLYLVVLAAGNVRHDYYQVITIPIISIFLAKGADLLLTAPKNYFNRVVCYMLLATSVMFMFAFSWYQMQSDYWINKPAIIEAGRAVDRLVPKDAKVIAPYGGDTAFLYQTNRQGWPVGFEIEDKVKKGANYYVNVNVSDPETDYVMKKYQVLEKTQSYVIVKLSP